jgi:chromosome segregation ATPase
MTSREDLETTISSLELTVQRHLGDVEKLRSDRDALQAEALTLARELAQAKGTIVIMTDQLAATSQDILKVQTENVALRAQVDLLKGQLDTDDVRIYELYLATRAQLAKMREAAGILLRACEAGAYTGKSSDACAAMRTAIAAEEPGG